MGLRNLVTENDTYVHPVLDPTTFKPLRNADGSPMTVTLFSPESREFRKRLKERAARKLEAGDLPPATPQEEDRDSAEFVALAIKEWHLTLDTEIEPFSYDAAVDILTNQNWLRSDWMNALGARKNFLVRSNEG
jgi:hypothetical protein